MKLKTAFSGILLLVMFLVVGLPPIYAQTLNGPPGVEVELNSIATIPAIPAISDYSDFAELVVMYERFTGDSFGYINNECSNSGERQDNEGYIITELTSNTTFYNCISPSPWYIQPVKVVYIQTFN